mgnify:CR=1 FL=1
MNKTAIVTWVMATLAGCLRQSQAKTLALFVAAAIRVDGASLAAIAQRASSNTALKYRVKRLWRFIDNDEVEQGEAMRPVIKRLLKKRKKRLLVAFDWTKIRNFHTLALVAVIRGRAAPLLWCSYAEQGLYRSQNNLEEGLLRLFRTMLPPGVEVVLLADRGFGRTELARVCQELGFHYVVRIKPNVWIRTPDWEGKLSDYPVEKGTCRLLRDVEYRRQHSVKHNVVVYWKKDLPKRRDECWFLMTDLDDNPAWLSALYARRMTIEEVFRDYKNRRNGFALRNTRIRKAERFDRLLLVLVLAYLLLIGLGLYAKAFLHPSYWCSTSKADQCSVFTIGRRMLDVLELSPAQALAQLRQATEDPIENWG